MTIREPWIVTAQCPHTGAVKRSEVTATTARDAIEQALQAWQEQDPEDEGPYEFNAYQPGDYLAAGAYPLTTIVCVRGGEVWPIAGVFTSPQAAFRHVESIEATEDLTNPPTPVRMSGPPTDFGHGRRWFIYVDTPDDDGNRRHYVITEHKGIQP